MSKAILTSGLNKYAELLKGFIRNEFIEGKEAFADGLGYYVK